MGSAVRVRPQGVVFDMDGVLIDSHPAHKHAWRELLQRLGRQVPAEDLEFVTDGRTRADIMRHFLGDLTDAQIKAYGVLKDSYFGDVCETIDVMPGVPRFLALLSKAGIPIAVATSACRSRATEILERLHLEAYFKNVVTACDVLHGKPSPDVYLQAAANLGADPKLVIAFEDAPSGVSAALGAGMTCVGVGSGARRRSLLSAGASLVIDGFRDIRLPEVLQILP